VAKLPPALEAAFEHDRRRFLAAFARLLLLRSILYYNLFLPYDFLLLPSTAWLSTFLHLCIVTPFMALAGLVAIRHPSQVLRDSLGALSSILIAGQILVIFCLNTGINANQYQYMTIIVILYTNIIQMLTLRFAMAASAAICTLYVVTLLNSGCPESVRLTGAIMMVTIAFLSLIAKARSEHSDRHRFLRRLQDRMRRHEAENEACRDALTGLSNRRHFDERSAALWRAGDAATPTAIAIIDIDHFKLFNDRYGHQAGDHCIKRVAGAISAALRSQNDLAVRFGGEEFVLLLPDTPLETALQITERIRRAVEVMAIPHEGSLTSPVVTVSIGVAAGTAGVEPVETLLATADQALYKAKRNGRNQVYPPFMTLDHPATHRAALPRPLGG